jgi:hypothetical protein
MVKVAQIVGTMTETFFDFFDLAVKKFCGSRIAPRGDLRRTGLSLFPDAI